MEINDNQLLPRYKPWYKKWWGVILIIVIIFILSFILAFTLYILDISKKIKNNLTDGSLATQILSGQTYQLEDNNNYWFGASNPKITIVEFADFSCPVCKNTYPKIREISLKYKTDVKIIFKDFPVVSEESTLLALTARCAGEQGFFWLMHDKLFQNQGISNYSELTNLANQIGADINKFNNCIDNEKYLTDIKKDYTEGEKLGVKGTPTWFINGYKIEGDIPYTLFIQLIDTLLKE
ncbi:MAG: thioredoxin domain-containing protein [Patescibacteria group bacterium]